jgi:salicylate hydroxylase
MTLKDLGFSFEKALVCRQDRIESVRGDTLDRLNLVDLSNAESEYGAPLQSILRSDLHQELLHMALGGENPAKLHLASQVQDIDANKGRITLKSGEVHHADLVIAADGVRSIGRNEVIDQDSALAETGMNAFRFLIPTKDIPNLQSLRSKIPSKIPGVTIFVDIHDKENERHMVWYDCHGGAIQNFVGIYPTHQHDRMRSPKELMLEQFAGFHPAVLELLRLTEEVTCWPLLNHKPTDTWSKGRLLLIGDAAHAMLPFGGQGANQAIEDGGVLGPVFQGAGPTDVPDRLKTFEALRIARVAPSQILSRARFGTELTVEHELKKYEKPGKQSMSSSSDVPFIGRRRLGPRIFDS